MPDSIEKAKSDPKSDEIEEILRRVDRLPILDDRAAEVVLDYDEQGLPR